MQPYLRLSRAFISVFAIFLLQLGAYAQSRQEITIIKSLDGAIGNLVKDSSISLQDSIYFDSALRAKMTAGSTVKNIITLRLNEFSRRMLPPKFSVKANVRIFYGVDGDNEHYTDKELTIDYDTSKPYSLRNSFVFNGAHSVKVQMTSVVSDQLQRVLPALMLDNEMRLVPKYSFSCSNDVITTITATPLNIVDEDRLPVNWPAVIGADVYDLEWTFIDSSALDANRYGNPVNPKMVFSNNATRITTSSTAYDIPLLYGKVGVLYYRVRPVQELSDTQRLESVWSSNYPAGFGAYMYNGHQRSLNWQSKVVFAEDGKRKIVTNYADGGLHNRQTVSIDNVTNNVIVGEQMYDLQGRGVIQVLPSPTGLKVLKYNPSLNVASGGLPYDKDLYDKVNSPLDLLTAHAPAMDSSSGTSNYYSSANPEANVGSNKYIPRANGYPFVETVFEPDNTGRIRKQGGVGDQYQIGSGREIRYYYSGASQEELDAMFGTEVGSSNHYFKNAVVDQNGQLSYSYIDMHGRTVATALAGKSSGSLLDLDSIDVVHVSEQLTKDSYDPRSYSLNLQESKLVPEKGVYTFKYDLVPPVLRLPNCSGDTLIYPGLYDLEIVITDDVMNQHLNGRPYKIVAHNYTTDYKLKEEGKFQFEFALELERGSYQINRSLVINQHAMEYYRDSIYFKSSSCVSFETILEEQKQLHRDSPCEPACSECGRSETPSTDEIRKQMLDDVTPPFGQYALAYDTTSIYSIFYLDHKQPPPYQRTNGVFVDINGQAMTILDPDNPNPTYKKPDELSPQSFIEFFEPQWANTLLKLHPEYCKLGIYEQYNDAQKWIYKFENTDSYMAAKQAGYLTPADAKSVNPDPLLKAAPVTLPDKVAKYQKIKVGTQVQMASMWTVAAMAVRCDGGDACMTQYNNATPSGLEATVCSGDLDMMWRNFRSYYLSAHKTALDSLAAINCTKQSAKPEVLAAAGKATRFGNVTNLLKDNGLGSLDSLLKVSTDPVNDTRQQLMQVYYRNIDSMAQTWLSQLAPCKFSPTALAEIKEKLLAVCKSAADADHPYGASTVKPGTNAVYKSFAEVLNAYNYAKGITDPLICNSELIKAPPPYDVTIKYSDRTSYTKPAQCECDNLQALVNEYSNFKKPQDTNLAAYVKRTRHLNFSQENLNELLDACSQSNTDCKYLPKPVIVPVFLQCSTNPSCVNCERINELNAGFSSAYPGLVPAYEDSTEDQRSINSLYATYMNTRLGFSKQTWEYLQFMDSCATGTGNTVKVCKPGSLESRQMIKTYNAGQGVDNINDIHETASGYIMAGSTNVASAGGKDAYVINTDTKGNYIWARTYGGEADDELSRLIPTTDGGFVGVGTTYSACFDNGAILLVKLNVTGEVVWNKTVDFAEFGAKGCDIVETATGGFAFTGLRKNGANYTHWVSGVLTNEGDVQWMNQEDLGLTGDYLGLVSNGESLVMAGSVDYGVGLQPVMASVSTADGTVISISKYTLSDSNSVRDFVKSGDALLMACDNGSNNRILSVDQVGNVLKAIQLSDAPETELSRIRLSATIDNGVLISRSGADVWLEALDAAMQPVWANHILLPGNERLSKLVQHSSGTYAGSGSQDGRALMVSATREGKTGCNDELLELPVSSVAAGKSNSLAGNIEVVSGTSFNTISLLAGNKSPFALSLNCPGIDSCYFVSSSILCGAASPIFPLDTSGDYNPCVDSSVIANAKAEEIYNYVKDNLTYNFQQAYVAALKSVKGYEAFTVSYDKREYQHTLYYYDQAGNLVKTVPPAGAKVNQRKAWLDSVAVARTNGAQVVPAHTLVTNYRYNTVGGVIEQQTPDGGKTKLWYDRLGRLSVSQNAKQHLVGNYSYTLYDNIGRITEVGQLASSNAMVDSIAKMSETWKLWFANAGASREQITRTVYDKPYPFTDGTDWSPVNLRNRIAWSASYPTINDTIPGGHTSATYYSYDIHGNVKLLMQDYQDGLASNQADRFKKIAYAYDLISGKVNSVSYQPGQVDAFYHRYAYDAENKIIAVETSKDSIYWERDASYEYAKHGVLTRTVLGQAKVQGVDYAYTLQGWLKGVNSTVLGALNDMGGDGSLSGLTAKDAYSFNLHYNNGDYSGIGGKAFTATNNVIRPLYNGNIAAMAVNLPKVGEPLMYNYTYDVLNRIKQMNATKGLDSVANKWNRITLPDFAESLAYDPNGNILKYKRNGNITWAGKSETMDSMQYHYLTGSNKLNFITDSVDLAAYENDIDGQQDKNYLYDEIGNLTSDVQGGIKRISWNIYGKISQIEKTDGKVIKYTYDIAGNRIAKRVGDLETRYLRDASGNVMSIYVTGDPSINNGFKTQTEIHLYGSSRLGIDNSQTQVANAESPETYSLPGVGSGYFTTFKRGNKFFELSNHLGNVLATVGDDKLGVALNDTTVGYYVPRIVSAQDYAPFGVGLYGRGYDAGRYRYGFNGKENDNEVKGEGNQQDYGFRIYDPRIAKFLSVDPLTKDFPWYTPYQFAGNTPIQAIDLDGGEDKHYLISFNEKTGRSQMALMHANSWGLTVSPYYHYKNRVYYFGDETPQWAQSWFGAPSRIAKAYRDFSGKTEEEMDKVFLSQKDVGQVAAASNAAHEKEMVDLFQGGFTTAWAVRRASTPEVSVSKQVSAAQGGATKVPSGNGQTASRSQPELTIIGEADGIIMGNIKYSNGKINEFLAEKTVTGTKMSLTNMVFYPQGAKGNELKNEFGTRAIMESLGVLKQYAQSQGAEQLRVQYKRAENSSSATPGHELDKTFDLKR
ncbi:RHS repeat domain-containing protein [Chitinophaga sp. sic0106]|uniref:RHS repeat domain-containing protein n=1 Tax=Chitinophaga sp. sic0106 TaxID=2854785 RepID=UPI001C494831|nr:RHS repeat-associated core domain-containing protein [Chitinophaga sp. sic0106]MBV7533912.1 hypothetical protein [Chitinophaga sp. sic0106]